MLILNLLFQPTFLKEITRNMHVLVSEQYRSDVIKFTKSVRINIYEGINLVPYVRID